MNISSWDNELRATAREVDILMSSAQQLVGHTDPTAYERLGRAADDGQFVAMVNDLRQSVEGAIGLPPRLAALYHWMGVLASKMLSYYENQSRLLAKMMWLKLVQGRLGGEASASPVIGDQEVVEMAIRKSNLKRTRDFLQVHLQKLQREKADLHQRYQALDTQKSNYWAAMSMRTQFGRSWGESAASPLLRSFNRFIHRLTLPTRVNRTVRARAEATRDLAEHRTSELIKDFKNLAVKSTSESRAHMNRHTSVKLKQGREELKRLESMLTQTEKELERSNTPSPRMKFVKNGNIGRRNTL